MAQAPPSTASVTPVSVTAVTATTISSSTPKEEFSMESMSQSTTVFHDQTHKNGAPIELDSSLPNNFIKTKKENQAKPIVTIEGGKMKGLALLQSLKSNTSSSENDDVLTDCAITASAQSQTKTKSKTQTQGVTETEGDNKSKKKRDSNSGVTVARASSISEGMPRPTHDQKATSGKLVLIAPSDITGVRKKFVKMQ